MVTQGAAEILAYGTAVKLGYIRTIILISLLIIVYLVFQRINSKNESFENRDN